MGIELVGEATKLVGRARTWGGGMIDESTGIVGGTVATLDVKEMVGGVAEIVHM